MRLSGEAGEASIAPPPFEWRANLGLFLATVVSVFATGALGANDAVPAAARIADGARFAGSLLSILLAHEFGHYFAARIHRVDASLPFFIPLPMLSPFGTMGAIIRMRGRIATRRALLDIGAAGPLAGLVLALPLYALGVHHSHWVPVIGSGEGVELGESLLIKGMDRLFSPGPAPPGMELSLSPIAFGAWGGFFVTMINLIPIGQLDGGHVAYALFGPRQDRYARIVHRAMLVFFAVGIAHHVALDLVRGFALHHLGERVSAALFWFVWFELLAVLASFAGAGPRSVEPRLSNGLRGGATIGLVVLASLGREVERRGHDARLFFGAWILGALLLVTAEARSGVLRDGSILDHPSTGEAPLGATRKVVAWLTLLAFVLLFMPTPFSM